MAYVNVPKDLSNVKTKVVFNLTKRQLVCFSIALAVGLPVFFLTKDYIGSSAAVMAMMVLMMPFFLLAMFERHGQPLEVIVKNFISNRFTRPKNRPYQTDNGYDALVRQSKLNSQRRNIVKGRKNKTKLSKKEQQAIATAEAEAKKKSPKKLSAQDTIPFERITPDGICQVDSKLYTKTIAFGDINYRIAQDETKTAIFDNWCNFLNYFDPSIKVQFSFLNTTEVGQGEGIYIHPREDDFNHVRTEYNEMLQNQLSRGNRGIVRTKYITFGIEADNFKTAKPRLERIEADLCDQFKRLGVPHHPLDGKERLHLLHTTLRLRGDTPFQFDWKWMAPSGMNAKDFIAPQSLTFGHRNLFQTGDTLGTVSFLQILAPKLEDDVLSRFLELQENLLVTMHIEALDQEKAVKMVKRTITNLDATTIVEQKKAVREGYDMDILPSDLKTYGAEAKKLLEELEHNNERLFLITFLVVNSAETKGKLDNLFLQTAGIANARNCQLLRLDHQQEQGFLSSLPLGKNLVPIKRSLTTSSTAIFVPFTTQELFQTEGEPLYYGLNTLSRNPIMVDRKALKTPNGLILGTPGSGKSFSAKREIANAFLVTNDDILIADPEAEYGPLVDAFHGQTIQISTTSKQHINPLDLNLENCDSDNPLALKTDFVFSLCELIANNQTGGLTGRQLSILDRCVKTIYTPYLADPIPEKMPILSDLYHALSQQEEPEAQTLSGALELYVTGSFNVFNHRTDVDIHNRLVCFDTKELGEKLKKLGMLIVQDQIWNRVTINRAEKRSTRYYVDEFHLLLKEEQTAAYSVEIWKRFRKWGGIPTGITQNVEDFLQSQQIANIFGNSDFVYMLNQHTDDRRALQKRLGISNDQARYIQNAGTGEGLIYYGGVILPFVDNFPKDTELYRIMTTKLDEAVS